jgi:hypothetical protein
MQYDEKQGEVDEDAESSHALSLSRSMLEVAVLLAKEMTQEAKDSDHE